MHALGAVIGLVVGVLIARMTVVLLLGHWDFDSSTDVASRLRLVFVLVVLGCGVVGSMVAHRVRRRREWLE